MRLRAVLIIPVDMFRVRVSVLIIVSACVSSGYYGSRSQMCRGQRGYMLEKLVLDAA